MKYKNPGPQKFIGEIKNAGNGGAFIDFPYSVLELYGVKGRVPVIVKFEDKIEYTGSLANMGGECHLVPILKSIRDELGKDFGDKVNIEIFLDTSERKVKIPEDLQKEFLKDLKAKYIFDELSFTHQKEYVKWIDEAKKQETRERRIIKTIEMLKQI